MVVCFVINSIVGFVGVFDVIKWVLFYLICCCNGFVNILVFYGVKIGVFFYLFLIGFMIVCDLIGGVIDWVFLFFVIGKLFN